MYKTSVVSTAPQLNCMRTDPVYRDCDLNFEQFELRRWRHTVRKEAKSLGPRPSTVLKNRKAQRPGAASSAMCRQLFYPKTTRQVGCKSIFLPVSNFLQVFSCLGRFFVIEMTHCRASLQLIADLRCVVARIEHLCGGLNT